MLRPLLKRVGQMLEGRVERSEGGRLLTMTMQGSLQSAAGGLRRSQMFICSHCIFRIIPASACVLFIGCFTCADSAESYRSIHTCVLLLALNACSTFAAGNGRGKKKEGR